MSFLAPLFFIGLGAIAIPILVHLIQREKKNVIEFASLMFVQRIPYQSVRRRRIRHWFLLLMRIAAIILIAMAFARPFLPERAAAAVAAIGGNRELVILLDRSASMGYGDHWKRATDAARDAISSIGANDKATLVLFDKNAEEAERATSDRGRLESALRAAKVTPAATQYGPPLKLAESILARSTLARREAILISDFQKSGWRGSEDVHFSESMRLTPVVIRSDKMANVSVPSVTFDRSSFSGQERVTVTAGVANKGPDTVNGIPVTLDIEGQQIASKSVSIGAGRSTSVVFDQFTLADAASRGVVRAGSDALPVDNAFHFVLTPSQSVSVLIVDSGDRAESSFYLAKALSIGNTPAFHVETLPAGRVSPPLLERRDVVVLNDTMVPPGLAGGELKRFVERGGGLLVAVGGHSTWPVSEADLLPGKLGGIVERTDSRGGTIGWRDNGHFVFEIFRAPRSGDFSAPRFRRYRALQLGPNDRPLAKYDDGAVAAAERRLGTGRVIAWTSTLDESWNDLAKKPVYLPLVHQIIKYLARYEQPAAWRTVGDVVDLAAKSKADRAIVTPSNERRTMHTNDPGLLELNEQGIYEIRTTAMGTGRPERIAVNVDPVESDLTVLDSQELVAFVTGHATQSAAQQTQAPQELTASEAERRQGLWWYLLVIGLLLLATEMVVANLLSRTERFL
jgi:hypothetical protein